MKNPTNITDLNYDQIALINKFLFINKFNDFSLMQINFIMNMTDSDVYGLSQHGSGIRGFFIKKRARIHYKNEQGFSCDALIKDFLCTINEDDYTAHELKKIIDVKRIEYRKQIVYHALILSTSNLTGKTSILYLNSALEPLYVKDVMDLSDVWL